MKKCIWLNFIGLFVLFNVVVFLISCAKKKAEEIRDAKPSKPTVEATAKLTKFAFTPQMWAEAVLKAVEMSPELKAGFGIGNIPSWDMEEFKAGMKNMTPREMERWAAMDEKLSRALAEGKIKEISVDALADFFVAEVPKHRAKRNRIKCVNNLGNVYKAGLQFAQDNGERHPWQLTTAGVIAHFNKTVKRTKKYGIQTNNNLTKGYNHTNCYWGPKGDNRMAALYVRFVYGLDAMKVATVTPKILHSPCDGARNASSQVAQKNWKTYQTMDATSGAAGSGDLRELQAGTGYVLSRGADTQRPTSLYANTRNVNRGDIGSTAKTYWLGSNKKPNKKTGLYHANTMSGLTVSQGQLVTMDGGARQSNDADLGDAGVISKAGKDGTGGVATGETSLSVIK